MWLPPACGGPLFIVLLPETSPTQASRHRTAWPRIRFWRGGLTIVVSCVRIYVTLTLSRPTSSDWNPVVGLLVSSEYGSDSLSDGLATDAEPDYDEPIGDFSITREVPYLGSPSADHPSGPLSAVIAPELDNITSAGSTLATQQVHDLKTPPSSVDSQKEIEAPELALYL